MLCINFSLVRHISGSVKLLASSLRYSCNWVKQKSASSHAFSSIASWHVRSNFNQCTTNVFVGVISSGWPKWIFVRTFILVSLQWMNQVSDLRGNFAFQAQFLSWKSHKCRRPFTRKILVSIFYDLPVKQVATRASFRLRFWSLHIFCDDPRELK